MNVIRSFFLTILFLAFLFIAAVKIKHHKFEYPKQKSSKITFVGNSFGKFKSEKRGTDYYYQGISKDSIVCSVFYYKLNTNDRKLMVDPFGGMISPGIPMIFFSENSNLKDFEINKSSWGEMTDDFMFRQCDIKEFRGLKINQKHMYAYGMLSLDLFVNVHLSKTNYTSSDSTKMRMILASIKKNHQK